jgi:hypothetical protein
MLRPWPPASPRAPRGSAPVPAPEPPPASAAAASARAAAHSPRRWGGARRGQARCRGAGRRLLRAVHAPPGAQLRPKILKLHGGAGQRRSAAGPRAAARGRGRGGAAPARVSGSLRACRAPGNRCPSPPRPPLARPARRAPRLLRSVQVRLSNGARGAAQARATRRGGRRRATRAGLRGAGLQGAHEVVLPVAGPRDHRVGGVDARAAGASALHERAEEEDGGGGESRPADERRALQHRHVEPARRPAALGGGGGGGSAGDWRAGQRGAGRTALCGRGSRRVRCRRSRRRRPRRAACRACAPLHAARGRRARGHPRHRRCRGRRR